jgi:hypothetical protein
MVGCKGPSNAGLLRFAMDRMLSARPAELLQLDPVGIAALVLRRRVIPGLALVASQRYHYSGIGSHKTF